MGPPPSKGAKGKGPGAAKGKGAKGGKTAGPPARPPPPPAGGKSSGRPPPAPPTAPPGAASSPCSPPAEIQLEQLGRDVMELQEELQWLRASPRSPPLPREFDTPAGAGALYAAFEARMRAAFERVVAAHGGALTRGELVSALRSDPDVRFHMQLQESAAGGGPAADCERFEGVFRKLEAHGGEGPVSWDTFRECVAGSWEEAEAAAPGPPPHSSAADPGGPRQHGADPGGGAAAGQGERMRALFAAVAAGAAPVSDAESEEGDAPPRAAGAPRGALAAAIRADPAAQGGRAWEGLCSFLEAEPDSTIGWAEFAALIPPPAAAPPAAGGPRSPGPARGSIWAPTPDSGRAGGAGRSTQEGGGGASEAASPAPEPCPTPPLLRTPYGAGRAGSPAGELAERAALERFVLTAPLLTAHCRAVFDSIARGGEVRKEELLRRLSADALVQRQLQQDAESPGLGAPSSGGGGGDELRLLLRKLEEDPRQLLSWRDVGELLPPQMRLAAAASSRASAPSPPVSAASPRGRSPVAGAAATRSLDALLAVASAPLSEQPAACAAEVLQALQLSPASAALHRHWDQQQQQQQQLERQRSGAVSGGATPTPPRRFSSALPASPPPAFPAGGAAHAHTGSRERPSSPEDGAGSSGRPAAAAAAEAKRNLRIGALAGRVAAIQQLASTSAQGRGAQRATLSTRLRQAEEKLRAIEATPPDLDGPNTRPLRQLSASCEQQMQALAQGAREWFARVRELREAAQGRGSKEVTEQIAPRVYTHLLHAGQRLRQQLAAEQEDPTRTGMRWMEQDRHVAALRARSDALAAAVRHHGMQEERLVHSMRTELGLLTVQIDEERARRKHLETVFVSLMESIILRLYQEMDQTFAERQRMEARLEDRLRGTVRHLGVTTGQQPVL
eukprot:TRINITY_DN4902_c0_g1_i3.p1 TRINITY_DN4902_c0_g1~~TRINITY_DN4902_c0_g1_i3.p1  ORF type:complete len:928 (+),score=336.81 TRINITY_DN4902_c0_g1_i3:75-2786(+)